MDVPMLLGARIHAGALVTVDRWMRPCFWGHASMLVHSLLLMDGCGHAFGGGSCWDCAFKTGPCGTILGVCVCV